VYGYFDERPSFAGHKTAVCILNDAGEGPGWGADAVKNEFVKLTLDKAPHIFVTPDTLQGYLVCKKLCVEALAELQIRDVDFSQSVIRDGNLIAMRDKPVPVEYQYLARSLTPLVSFNLQKWDVFDTGKGLFYIHYKEAPFFEGIRYRSFKYVTQLNEASIGSTKAAWPKRVAELFDVAQWKAFTSQEQNHCFMFMFGHGSPASSDIRCEIACGVDAEDFALILHFINNNLPLDMLGVITCYWTADRMLQLMKQMRFCSTFNFSLCTPISLQEPVRSEWFTTIDRYEGINAVVRPDMDDFYTGLNNAVAQNITAELAKESLKNVDAVINSREYGEYKDAQQPAFIAARTSYVQKL
jgi:hypothetical protein